jgi:hypothetical protein
VLCGVASAASIRAAYFYGDMPVSHLDSLAAAGFNRALVKFSTDSLDSAVADRVRALGAAARRNGVWFVPSFNLQSRSRLASPGTLHRYTWGSNHRVEQELACPMDSAYWHSALIDHAEEFLAASPDVKCLLLDLEVYFGTPHHYDRGPCRCSRCLSEYPGRPAGAGLHSRELSGLQAWEEVRLARILTPMLVEFAARHPEVEIGVFDLDLDSFVHRALARALARSRVPTVAYSEATYGTGVAPLAAIRERLTALGLGGSPIIGGFWLQKWASRRLELEIAEMNRSAEGYFIFTSFSLWFDPKKLAGPYTLPGVQADYWAALRRANRRLIKHPSMASRVGALRGTP